MASVAGTSPPCGVHSAVASSWSGGPAVWCPAVQCPAVWCPARPASALWRPARLASGRLVATLHRPAGCCPPPSVRTHPSRPHLRRWCWGPGRCNGRPAPQQRVEVPLGCHVLERLGRQPSRPGRGRRYRGRVLVNGMSVADPGRVGAGGFGRACPLSDQAGQGGVPSVVANGCAVAREQAAARGCRSGRVAAVLGWVGDHGEWWLRCLTPGWGAVGGPAGMGMRPQRGPGRQRALPARRWQRSELRGSWWACQDLNLGPHPYQQTAGNRCADRRSRRSPPTVGAKVMWSTGTQ